MDTGKGRTTSHGFVVQNLPERSLSLERRLSWSRPPPRPLSRERDRLSLDRDRDLWRLWKWRRSGHQLLENDYTSRQIRCLDIKVMDVFVPLPPTPIELSPQFTRNGLQMHEVTEATTSAFSLFGGKYGAVRAETRRQHGRGITAEAYNSMLMWI